jgi:capsular exopolysaccharide synthesis family protein
VGNVFDAMKKHQKEQQGERPAPAPRAPAGPNSGDQGQKTPSLAELMKQQPEQGSQTPVAEPVSPLSTQPPARPAAKPLQSPVDNGKFAAALKAHHDRGGSITEEYRTLRTSLLAQNPDERFCYMVTSANPKEGKTVTCTNLALVMAERTDMTTVIVDCDLRKRTVAELLGASQTPGVAELLIGEANVDDIVQPTCYPNLFLIPAGDAKFDRVGEITTSRDLEEMVGELRKQYDYVIFDAPPINGLSDAGMLGRVVGEALVVVQMNKTRKESVEKAVRLLHAAHCKVAGMVLTHRKYHIPSYIYRYA